MQLGERIFRLRQKSGQSLQDVADGVKVSKAHIWELEKGRSKNPSFELVRQLALHFGVSVDTLVGDAKEPGTEEMQIGRIHRDLEELSPGDRNVIEATIAAMRAKNKGA